ncbi:MAG: NrfD/PsrC family molybdoenzyme membrane anchor subunit [Dehalococcoidia bacterium]
MRREFSIDELRPQRAWDWKVALYLFAAGTAGGLIFVELVLRSMDKLDENTSTWGAWIGLAVAAFSLLVLFTHLGPGARWRFMHVFRRPRTAWLSRGAIIVTVLMALRLLVVLPTAFEDLPWDEESIAGTILRVGVWTFAAAFMAYSGLVLSSWRSIPFWNTPLLPILYVGYSFLGGVAALPIVALLAEGRGGMEAVGDTVWPLLLALLGGNSIVLLIYLWGMSTATRSARESARRLIRGDLAVLFLLGVAVLGLTVPLVLVVVGSASGVSPASWLFFVSGIMILGGGFLLRHCVIKAGVYAPLV